MPFLILGTIIFLIAIFFWIEARKHNDYEGMVGTSTMAVAGLLLVLLYGLLYRALILL